MNERIKELWSQAGGHYNSGNQHTWPEYTIDDPEKFAELIVKECAEIADNADATREKWQSIGTFVKEHFAVEE